MICCGRNSKKAGMSVPSDRKDIRQENRTGFPALYNGPAVKTKKEEIYREQLLI